jgi:energy-coupling factor transporter ATP-binding protein EcfA2
MDSGDRRVILEAVNLSFSYPHSSQPVLCDLSLQVNQGESIGITGPAGSGKTTLLLALCGAIPQLIHGRMAGDVVVSGLNTKRTEIAELARHVTLVMQDPDLQLFGSSIFEDVTFGLENLRFPVEQISARAEWALMAVGMCDLRDRPSSTLSGGQKQRAALACTLAMGSEIIVLDEPTSELDPAGTEDVFRVLGDLRAMGTTIVIAEQNLEHLARLVDRLVYIRQGNIHLQAPQQEFFEKLLSQYLCADLDISIPQTAVLAFELARDGHIFAPIPLNEGDFLTDYQHKRRSQ